jgi:hypothetical protein
LSTPISVDISSIKSTPNRDAESNADREIIECSSQSHSNANTDRQAFP